MHFCNTQQFYTINVLRESKYLNYLLSQIFRVLVKFLAYGVFYP